MPTYIALLRGINVSGHKQVKMSLLQELFRNLGFEHVQTYIQSGNVIFNSPSSPVSTLAAKVKTVVQKEFGYSVPVLIIPAVDLERVLQNNPFLREKNIDPSKLFVTFLSQAPSKPSLVKLTSIKTGRDRFHSEGNLVYLHCPNGYGGSKLSNNTIEKTLNLEATTRNWKTVNELYRLSS